MRNGVRGFRQAACVGDVAAIRWYVEGATEGAKRAALNSAIVAGNVPAVRELLAGVGVVGRQMVLAASLNHGPVVNELVPYVDDIDAVGSGGFTALMWAARHGDVDVVTRLVERCAMVDRCNDRKLSALYFAIYGRHLNVARTLVRFGACAKGDPVLQRVFVDAARAGDVPVVRLLIEAGVDIDVDGMWGVTEFALMAATREKRAEVMGLLLDAGAMIDKMTPKGHTALMEAASGGDLSVVMLLLEAGADVNLMSKKKMTPVMFAAARGHVEIVKLLIESFSNLGMRSVRGYTVLDIAVTNGHFQVAKLLIEAGTRHNPALPLSGCLGRAVKAGAVEVVGALLEADVDPNCTDGMGVFPIEHAVRDVEIVRLLCRAGANVRVVSREGVAPLESAAKADMHEVVHVLVRYGAEVNRVDERKWTPLLVAAKEGNDRAVCALLKEGANEHVTDGMGRTALDIVVESGLDERRREVAETLVAWGTKCREFSDVVNNMLGESQAKKKVKMTERR